MPNALIVSWYAYPIIRRSYKEVHRFLLKQSHRPFIKRYLQRDEVQRALAGCNASITDSLTMFNVSRLGAIWD